MADTTAWATSTLTDHYAAQDTVYTIFPIYYYHKPSPRLPSADYMCYPCASFACNGKMKKKLTWLLQPVELKDMFGMFGC